MKSLKENLKLIVAFICLIAMCYPVIYNFNNPEITKMQLFLKFWWLYLVGVLGIGYGVATSK